MLYSQRLVKFDTLGHQVRVKVVELAGEKRCKVFWNLVALLQTRAQPVGQRSDVRHVVVLADLGLLLHVTLELGLPVLAQQPLEDSFLDFLVVLILEKLIRKKFHRSHHKKFPTLLTTVKRSHRAIRRETDRPAG